MCHFLLPCPSSSNRILESNSDRVFESSSACCLVSSSCGGGLSADRSLLVFFSTWPVDLLRRNLCIDIKSIPSNTSPAIATPTPIPALAPPLRPELTFAAGLEAEGKVAVDAEVDVDAEVVDGFVALEVEVDEEDESTVELTILVKLSGGGAWKV